MCFLWSWRLDYITWLLLLRLILHLHKWDLAGHENEFCSKWQNDNWWTLKFDNLSHFQNVIRNDSPPSKRKRHYNALRTKIDMWLTPKTKFKIWVLEFLIGISPKRCFNQYFHRVNFLWSLELLILYLQIWDTECFDVLIIVTNWIEWVYKAVLKFIVFV